MTPLEKNPQKQLKGELNADITNRNSYKENYSVEEEIHQSVKKVIQEMREKQTD